MQHILPICKNSKLPALKQCKWESAVAPHDHCHLSPLAHAVSTARLILHFLFLRWRCCILFPLLETLKAFFVVRDKRLWLIHFSVWEPELSIQRENLQLSGGLLPELFFYRCDNQKPLFNPRISSRGCSWKAAAYQQLCSAEWALAAAPSRARKAASDEYENIASPHT